MCSSFFKKGSGADCAAPARLNYIFQKDCCAWLTQRKIAGRNNSDGHLVEFEAESFGDSQFHLPVGNLDVFGEGKQQEAGCTAAADMVRNCWRYVEREAKKLERAAVIAALRAQDWPSVGILQGPNLVQHASVRVKREVLNRPFAVNRCLYNGHKVSIRKRSSGLQNHIHAGNVCDAGRAACHSREK